MEFSIYVKTTATKYKLLMVLSTKLIMVGGADLVFTFRPRVVYFSNHRSIAPCTSPDTDGFCDKRFTREVIVAVWQKLQSIADGV